MLTKITLVIFVLTLSFFGFSQGRLILNENVFINITNGAKVVLENSNANAITETGTASQIISEGETNEIIWRIGNSTGTYTIPWGTTPAVSGGNGTKIPFSMVITGAGTPANTNAAFRFSTYETATDMNTTWHSRVNNMTGANTGVDNSLFVVDRFWQLDGTDYTTRPSATLSFTYDDAANEIGGTNTITEGNLRAQRWNDASGSWQGLLFGTIDATSNVVSSVDFNGAGFHEVWTLTDLTSPLPAEFGKLSVVDANCENLIHWTTISERNNDYFVVQKSSDLVNWENIGQVDGAGNSTVELSYEFLDTKVESNEVVYYRIQQVDFDGTTDVSDIVSIKSNCSDSNAPSIYPNPFDQDLTIYSKEALNIGLIDSKGKVIRLINSLPKGVNTITLDNLAAGIYFLQAVNENNDKFVFKLVKN